jgi:hypothetical protein
VGLTFILNSWNCLETKVTKQKEVVNDDDDNENVGGSAYTLAFGFDNLAS